MNNQVTHSIMFHHFHDEIHLPAQGSLSSYDFIKMVDWLSKNYSLIGANDYILKYENKTLKEKDICLSFDDALKCQYDIAIPILKDYGIDAFFFVYSAVFSDEPDPLEIYRYFRTSMFENIDAFYDLFFKKVLNKNKSSYDAHNIIFNELDYLKELPYHSDNDRWFRYIRDQYLSSSDYDIFMAEMMAEMNFDVEAAKKNLWMTEEELKTLSSDGHLIGLHSYSHPTQINKLSKSQQLLEYTRNYEHLKSLLKKEPISMSHPCGLYNQDTLEILKSLGIKIGFCSSMKNIEFKSSLEIPRENHANILKKMQL
ncbi:polysaccharide deacetylase family protein [SAR86 cluster bacterium]|nr:polysaccharide deacetylase family protein [SAR86 cluster bacterium]